MLVEPALIGRAAPLEAVTAALTRAADGAGPNTIIVTGLAGSGTSTVIRQAAQLLEERFPDGCVTVDAAAPHVPASGGTLLHWALRELGLRPGELPQSLDGRAAAYRTLLTGRRRLIIVDNAVRPYPLALLAPPGPTSALLVASRWRSAQLSNAVRFEIDPLPTPEAVVLVAALTCWRRVRSEPDAAEQLVALCAGLPLALRAAGARLANEPDLPIRDLVAQLSDPQQRLDRLDVDGLSVRASLARGTAALSREAVTVLRAMGASPAGGITSRSLASRLGVPATRVWHALEELADVRLAASLPRGRYVLPNGLVRQYARELPAR